MANRSCMWPCKTLFCCFALRLTTSTWMSKLLVIDLRSMISKFWICHYKYLHDLEQEEKV
jgi:hypothetical protein